ncbi:TPA: hypothetical protein ACH3X2_009317 [Trebouxia sp. C0005]
MQMSLQRSQVRASHEPNVTASSPTFRAYGSQGSRRPMKRPAPPTASDSSVNNWLASLYRSQRLSVRKSQPASSTQEASIAAACGRCWSSSFTAFVYSSDCRSKRS